METWREGWQRGSWGSRRVDLPSGSSELYEPLFLD